MRKAVIVGLAAVLSAGAGIVIASTPFGGDDSGAFIPPTKDILKCENTVGKGVSKMVGGILKCHASRAGGKITDETGEDACEDAAQQKFVDKIGPKTTTCDSCTNLTQTKNLVEILLDSNNNKVYCGGAGAAWGGDDTGKLPDTKDLTKCEQGIGKGVAKLVKGIIKCHASRATGKLADDTAEDTCEGTAKTAFTTKFPTPCDPCQGTMAGLADFIEGQVDGAAGLVYCASPSGAFLN